MGENVESSKTRKLQLFTVAAVVAASIAVPAANSAGVRGVNSLPNRNDCKDTNGATSSFGVLAVNHGTYYYICSEG